MGCLTAPFKLLGFLLLVAALALGWLYRDRLAAMGRAAWREARGEPSSEVASGAPAATSLESARRKIATLAASRADSVVLDASETASLLREGLDPYASTFFDSMQVRLADNSIGVAAVVRTDRLPANVLGPFARAIRPREPMSAEGPLSVTAAGRGLWEVRRMQFRNIPLPRDAVPKLLGRAVGDSTARALPIRLPAAVRGARVRPGGLTLYRTPQ